LFGASSQSKASRLGRGVDDTQTLADEQHLVRPCRKRLQPADTAVVVEVDVRDVEMPYE
jgi:hypothetical protein